MPINKFGIQVYSANDPDFLEWIHPTIPERPPYLHPQYRTGRYTMIDGVKVYSLRKVENGVHHGSQIYHNLESGNNRVFITGAQVREQRKEAAVLHGENSERVRKIGRETFRTYRQEGHDFRTYGTKPQFNGYDVKSKWNIIDYQSAEHKEEVLELTGDRTGNTIDEDLKFHFTRFEGNAEEALKDAERYRYYFALASISYNPKVDKATHRNSKRFWDTLRAEEQRRLENELLENDSNIEIDIPENNKGDDLSVIEEEGSVLSDSESDDSSTTMKDVSLEVNADSEQQVSFSKTFSDDSIKSLIEKPKIINLNEFIRGSAPEKPGILCSSLILGKVVDEAKDSVVVRRRSRVPKNIMNPFNSSSSSSKFSSLSSSSNTVVSNDAAASNEAQENNNNLAAAAAAAAAVLNKTAATAEVINNFPPPPSFLTPPGQPMLVTAPISINFEYSESAPTITPPTPFINSTLNKIDEIAEVVGGMAAEITSKLATRDTPPPKMMSLAEPEYKSITIEAEDVWEDSKEEMKAQIEEYHEGAEIDAKTIEDLNFDSHRQRRIRSQLYTQVNTLRVAGSAMSLIINRALAKFNTNRFDMDLQVSESHSSTRRNPRISLTARKASNQDSNCTSVPKCDPESDLRCTLCELQWATSVLSVIWNDAMNSADLTDAEFLIDHFNPRTVNGPPPDYFSKPSEISLTEQQIQPTKRCLASTPTQNVSTRRRLNSEDISSADDSLAGRESLEIRREVAEQYITESVMLDSDLNSVASENELPRSETGDMQF